MDIRNVLDAKNIKTVFSTRPDALVSDAIDDMVTRDIGSILVMQDEKMVGLITLRDIVRALKEKGKDLLDAKVESIMKPEPVTALPTTSIDEIRSLMIQHHVSHVPIMEEDKLVGVVSFFDVARTVLSETKFENELLKRYIRNWPEEQEQK